MRCKKRVPNLGFQIPNQNGPLFGLSLPSYAKHLLNASKHSARAPVSQELAFGPCFVAFSILCVASNRKRRPIWRKSDRFFDLKPLG